MRAVPKPGSKALWILIGLVLIPSLFLRLHPRTSESFQYDAVISQMAAGEGIVANALDTRGTFGLRRSHPPLLSYIIEINNRLLGDDPFHARIFSIVFGALTCLLAALAIATLLPAVPGRFVLAIFGGWLLCLLPVHLYVSRTSNWDAVYGFFATGSLVFLALYVQDGAARRLFAAAAFAGLAFLTCELALSLLPAFLFVLLRDFRHLHPPRVLRRWSAMLLLVAVLFALLWPAGMFKLDLGRTLVFRWRDSTSLERNLPWQAFYATLFQQSPAFTLFVVAAAVATGFFALKRGSRNALRDFDASHVLVASVPFWLYVAVAFLHSLRERLVYIHHIVDMFPPLVIALCLGLAIPVLTRGRGVRLAAAGGGLLILAFSVTAALNPDPEVVGPQEHPGFLGVSEFLRDHPGARVYCYDTAVLGFYLPNASIEGGESRLWTAGDVARAKRGSYDFVVFDRAKLGNAYPTADSLIHALAPEYRLSETIAHRRTGEPVAWILSPPPAGKTEVTR